MRLPLTRSPDGHTPGLVISPRCKALRKGFNSTYRYRRVHLVGETKYQDVPEKNDASHVHDALQYLLSGGGEHSEVMGRKAAREDGHRQTHAATEDNPQGAWEGGGGRGQTHAVTE